MSFTLRKCSLLTKSVVQWRSVRCISTQGARWSLVDVLDNARDGDVVTVQGFVQSARKQKRVAFASLSDGSSLEPLQAVLSPKDAENLSTGVAVSVTGKWTSSPAGKKQAKELQATSVRILGENDAASYPIQKKYHSPEFLRTVPHLRPRIAYNAVLLRLRSQVISSLTAFFDDRGFVQTHTPIITSSDCEGAGEVFTVEAPEHSSDLNSLGGSSSENAKESFFRTTKYLTVSSQLHLEALASAVKNVWTLSPTFRAEKSDTARHLSEFYMLEGEMAFVEDADEVMNVIEDMIKSVVARLANSKLGDELCSGHRSNGLRDANEETEREHLSGEALKERWHKLASTNWPRITYHQACNHITAASKNGEAHFESLPSPDSGLDTEHERYIAEAVGRGGPVFVTDYPKSIKPFYMLPSKPRPAEELGPLPTVACWDLLMPGVCEVVGGSLREHRLDELEEAMKDKGLALGARTNDADAQEQTGTGDAGLQWYLDLRRYGSVPHGGWGLGFDRLLGYLAGVNNVRDIVTFPRYHKRCLC